MVNRNLVFNCQIKIGQLEFSQGILKEKTCYTTPLALKDKEALNQKELIKELRQMHIEMMQVLKAIEEKNTKLIEAMTSQAFFSPGNKTQIAKKTNQIDMDESVFVTNLEINDVEKHFESLAHEEKSEDKSFDKTKNKLRKFKKGE